MMWKEFMTEALKNTPIEDFPASEAGPQKAAEPEPIPQKENWEVPASSENKTTQGE